MLEIESGHIAELDDEMLRDLIGLLCEEELKSHGINVRNVMWSGNQNAPDGGLDVYCEYEGEADSNSFIPRNKAGFQVKLSDYGPSRIKGEMLKNGVLKEPEIMHGRWGIHSCLWKKLCCLFCLWRPYQGYEGSSRGVSGRRQYLPGFL